MYDFAIEGAGPAGLAAAVTAAERGHSVVVVEKGPIAGPEPRGESMPYHQLVDDLVRPGFLKEISGFTSYSRRFHSAGAVKNTLVKVREPYYFFEWRNFIDPLYDKALSRGVEFIFNAEAAGVNESSGLQYRMVDHQDGVQPEKDTSKKADLKEIEASVILGCGGRSSGVAACYGIDTRASACPTVKYRGRLNSPLPRWMLDFPGEPDLQFFTLLPGSFRSVKNFPPAFAYIFPVGNDHFEAGMMLRLSQLEKLKNVTIPDDVRIMEAWKEAKEELPLFSDFFEDSTTEYEQLTSIQNRRFLGENIMSGGKAVLIGDAVGLVDANGSSGMYYAMAHAAEWVKLLSEALQAGRDLSSADTINHFYREQNSWDFYRYIRKSFSLISVFEKLIFRTLGKEKRLNFFWPLIGAMLKAAS